MRSESSGRSHIRALDGLRGIAILWVLLLHFLRLDPAAGAVDAFYWRLAQTGRMGVDLFFVLSGFLITRILLATREQRGYFRTFYARRALRIFPLYYLAVGLAVVALPALLGVTPGLEAVRKHQPWFWLYGTNYLVARSGWGALGDLSHFWSLAVEEQFYLLWPLAVFWLGRSRLTLATAALLIAAPAIRMAALLSGTSGEAVYVATHLRFDGLGLGALLALIPATAARSARYRRAAAMLLLAGATAELGLLLAAAHPAGLWTVAIKHTLVPLWCAALLYLAVTGRPGSPLRRFLEARWLRSVGKYSYAVYVFHVSTRDLLVRAGLSIDAFPTVAGSYLPGQMVFNLVAGAAAFLVAWASWHLFEKRILALKRFFPYEARRARGGTEAPERAPHDARADARLREAPAG
ncbi:MAG TPA: acyltransferase [Longimicrobiales bacterium]